MGDTKSCGSYSWRFFNVKLRYLNEELHSSDEPGRTVVGLVPQPVGHRSALSSKTSELEKRTRDGSSVLTPDSYRNHFLVSSTFSLMEFRETPEITKFASSA